jgi:hypothetical protein
MDPLLKIIEGIPPAKNLNRLHDAEQNIKAVKAEFVGKPLVCHELVKHIVYLRRGIEVEQNTQCFYALLDKYMDEILEHYDLRWLLSICDTLVDIGDPARSAAAMNLVQCVNYLNIISSLLDVVNDGRINGDKLRRNPGHKRPTFDGMIALDMYSGDMMYNLQTRMNRVAAQDPLVNDIWEEIKHRLVDDPSVPTNWLSSVHFDQEKKVFYHDDC